MSEYNPKSNVTFGSVNLSTYNAFAIYCNIFDRPERDVDVVSVPGRNGDLIFDNGRYKNLDRVYTIQVTGVANAQNLINALTKANGYQELEDDYDTTVYYMARLKNRPRVTQFVGNAVLLTVTFDRKPQRFLKSGRDTPVTGTYIGNTQIPNGHWFVNYTDDRVYGIIKIPINNTSPETVHPRIYIPGGQVDYTYTVEGFQIDENLSTPTQSYFIRENELFVTDHRIFDSNNFIEINSETRIARYETLGMTFQGRVYKFPELSPGMNYLYIAFGNINSTLSVPDWSKLKSPQVYVGWWEL